MLLRSRPAEGGDRGRRADTATAAPATRRRGRHFAAALFLAGMASCAILLSSTGAAAQTVGDSWRELAVAPEHRCTPYARRDYPYAQAVEAGRSSSRWIFEHIQYFAL